jgi:hypothetical protein
MYAGKVWARVAELSRHAGALPSRHASSVSSRMIVVERMWSTIRFQMCCGARVGWDVIWPGRGIVKGSRAMLAAPGGGREPCPWSPEDAEGLGTGQDRAGSQGRTGQGALSHAPQHPPATHA